MHQIIYQIFITISVVLLTEGRSTSIPWWQIKAAESQGPNACIVEEVPGSGWKYWTECKFWPTRKICGHDTILRYECCEGYRQIPGEDGCRGVKPLRNVLETARGLGATKFVRYLEESGIAPELTQEDLSFTLFAPSDMAFNGPTGDIAAMKIESFLESAADQNPLLRYHISSDGRFCSKDFSGNTELKSQYQGNILRVNKYSSGMETVNCVLISRKDQEASNGVVHLIDSPLDPTHYMPRNVGQVILEDGRFTKMADALTRCGFLQRFRDPGQTFTILAPSDEAFLKIPPNRLERMISDPDSCTALLENHVIPHVLCMPAITEDLKVRTMGSTGRVQFGCDDKSHLIQGHRLQGDHMMGINGVVYVLDDVLIPDRSRTILELVESHGLGSFYQLIRVAGLEETFSSTHSEYTLFVPSEAALINLGSEVLDEAFKNPEVARRIVLYHAIEGRVHSQTIKNNQMVISLDEENPLRFVVYRRILGVENALFERSDFDGINGCLHVINKVLFPARESAGDILRKSGNFTIFLEAMENVQHSMDFWEAGTSAAHYTFFVPTDDAFRQLESSVFDRIESDPTFMTQVLRGHVSKSLLSSESFKDGLIYQVETEEQDLDVLCQQGKMKVGGAKTIEQDIVSTNGLIHTIEKVLLPTEPDAYLR